MNTPTEHENSVNVKKEDVPPEIEPLTWKFWLKKRYIVVSMLACGMTILNFFKMALSIGIVAMTKNITITDNNGVMHTEQIFPWNYQDRGFILSSFFYGFTASQMISGYLSTRFGGGLVFSISVIASAGFTLCVPVVAGFGYGYLIVLRTLTGLFEGASLPSLFETLSHWAPPKERARIIGICYSLGNFGVVLGMALCGTISQHFGWESIFYVMGVPGVIWYLIWILIIYDTPAKDKRISNDELRYLQDTIGHNSSEIGSTPWSRILTSWNVWGLIVVYFVEGWGFFSLLTQLPTFLNDALGFDLENSGFLSSLPYLTYAICLTVAGYFADFIPSKGYLTLKQTRRTFSCGGFFTQALFMILLVIFMRPTESITFMIISLTFAGFSYTGFGVTFLEIAPKYVGILLGMGNTAGSFAGIISPIISAFILKNQTIDEWRIVFSILASLYVLAGVMYWFSCSTEIQSWAKDDFEDFDKVKRKSSIEVNP